MPDISARVLEIGQEVPRETLNRILELTESREIIWHHTLCSYAPHCYQAKYDRGIDVVMTMDVYPQLQANGDRIARFLIFYPNLLGPKFNTTGPFFDSSMKLINAVEKQMDKRLQ